MTRRVVVMLCVLLSLLAQAGVGEALENGLHFAARGHFAHGPVTQVAEPEEQDSHRDIEHGCVGHFHVCPCCSHQLAADCRSELSVLPANSSRECLAPATAAEGPQGAARSIFRPPIQL